MIPKLELKHCICNTCTNLSYASLFRFLSFKPIIYISLESFALTYSAWTMYSTCKCMCIWVHICIYVYVRVCMCEAVCMFLYVWFVHVFLHMSMLGMCVPVYMYISMCVYICMRAYMHMFLHAWNVCMCLCLYRGTTFKILTWTAGDN